ncbi:MAG: hypothetical protein V1762_00225 [Nitrospirota bacterium]
MKQEASLIFFLLYMHNTIAESADIIKTICSGPPVDNNQSVSREPVPAPVRSAPYICPVALFMVESAEAMTRPKEKNGNERIR